MSTNTTEGIQSYPHDQESTVTEAIASFVESTTSALAQSDAPESAVSAVRESGEELAQTVGETVERQSEEIEELRGELEEERDTRAHEDAQDRQRLHAVETAVEEMGSGGTNPTLQAGETTIQEPDLVPMERIVSGIDVSEVVSNDLESIERAETLFENMTEWAEKTPKGLVYRADTNYKKLLEAERGEKLAWRQVYRACAKLEQLTKGAITCFENERHGRLTVLHKDTEVYDRLTSGVVPLSLSSEGETG